LSMIKPLFLFFYHKDDEITKSCYRQLCLIEGEQNVVPVSNNLSYLPNTFCLNNFPALFNHGDDYWMYDGLIYKYVLLNKDLILSKDAIITLEYDVWWNLESKNWLPTLIKDFDLAGSEIVSFNKEPSWTFFHKETTALTGVKKSDLIGIRPLAVSCSKPQFLVKVAEFFDTNTVFHQMVNCELRFGTLFKIVGAKIGELPFKKTIKWYQWIVNNVKEKEGIFHPIKNMNQIINETSTNVTLTHIFNKYNSDKGSIFESHQYAKDYEKLIDKNINNLLEIGIGADWSRPDWKDPLGNCGSIRGWLEWLPNTTIYGFDIKDCTIDLKENNKFKLLIGNQAELEDLNKLKDFIPDCDVIIDDGSHISSHQITTFNILWDKLKIGGLYFIEDVHCRWGQPPHTLEFLQNHPNFLQFFGRDNHGMVFKK
jgi:hypothetical protein